MMSSPSLMPIEQAQQHISQSIKAVSEIELCDLDDALSRVLAEDILSPFNVPSFDNSAMDGYALRQQDLAHCANLQLIGESFAGAPFSGEVKAGQCVRIMTGAVLPSGADTVVMQENTRSDGKSIEITQPPELGEAVRPAGEDIAKGAVVLSKGKQLSPVDIGLLASLGIDQLKVLRQLKVALLSTGDELCLPGSALPAGHIYDSNRPALRAILNKLGVSILDLGIVADDKQQLTQAFKQADQQADFVISSGGVSVGVADHSKEVLAELGQTHFWQLAIKPGKPLAFGRLPNSWFFGLPGNPVSAVVTFHQIVLPALQQMAGISSKEAVKHSAIAASTFNKRPGRKDYQRAICWHDDNGQLRVKPIGNQSSGVLSSLSKANCYAILEQQRGNVAAGEQVIVQLFDHYLS